VTTPRILFLNQVAGPLFRELAEDVAAALGRSVLLTGHSRDFARPLRLPLQVLPGPDYDRRNVLTRAWSWSQYFIAAAWLAWRTNRKTLLFLVSNPPFLPLVGYLLHYLRGQRYAVLVYDIYPNVLENLGRIKKGGVIGRLWRAHNRLVWSQASVVFTIGNYMAANIKAMLAGHSHGPQIIVVSNWADATFVKPLPKDTNWFAKKHNQQGKLTVLYSGNLGSTHDIGTIVGAARQIRQDSRVRFLIIGSGEKWTSIENAIASERLTNLTLLPLQPEDALPFSLTTGDIAIVTLEKGIEGLSVPSKIAYALASGAAVIGISHGPNEIADLITNFKCGMNVESGDTDGLVRAIQRFNSDQSLLNACRKHSRQALEESFSRANTHAYVDVLRRLIEIE
jgi:glycosyltransferase involved in cell wall biosynthesis